MRKIRVTIKDSLGFWNESLGMHVPNPGYTPTNTYVWEVPDAWVAGDQLAEGRLEDVFKHVYGDRWRLGNDDGSMYFVLESKVDVLPPGDATEAKPFPVPTK